MLIVIFLGLFGIWLGILAVANSWGTRRLPEPRPPVERESRRADLPGPKPIVALVYSKEETPKRSEILAALQELWREILRGA